MAKRFNQQSPGLVTDLDVFVNADQSVKALVFSTDDYPYVVQLDNGQRDVPWREGTRTASAHRHELIDLLHPHIAIPRAELLSANLVALCMPRITDKRTRRQAGQLFPNRLVLVVGAKSS